MPVERYNRKDFPHDDQRKELAVVFGTSTFFLPRKLPAEQRLFRSIRCGELAVYRLEYTVSADFTEM